MHEPDHSLPQHWMYCIGGGTVWALWQGFCDTVECHYLVVSTALISPAHCGNHALICVY